MTSSTYLKAKDEIRLSRRGMLEWNMVGFFCQFDVSHKRLGNLVTGEHIIPETLAAKGQRQSKELVQTGPP